MCFRVASKPSWLTKTTSCWSWRAMWCSTQCEQAWYKTLFNGPGALTTARCWHPAGCLALTGWPLTSCWLTFYVNDVREGIGLPSVWEDLSGQVYLGDEKFVNKMSAMAEQTPQGARTGRSRLEIPHAQRRPVPLPLQGYVSDTRTTATLRFKRPLPPAATPWRNWPSTLACITRVLAGL